MPTVSGTSPDTETRDRDGRSGATRACSPAGSCTTIAAVIGALLRVDDSRHESGGGQRGRGIWRSLARSTPAPAWSPHRSLPARAMPPPLLTMTCTTRWHRSSTRRRVLRRDRIGAACRRCVCDVSSLMPAFARGGLRRGGRHADEVRHERRRPDRRRRSA